MIGRYVESLCLETVFCLAYSGADFDNIKRGLMVGLLDDGHFHFRRGMGHGWRRCPLSGSSPRSTHHLVMATQGLHKIWEADALVCGRFRNKGQLLEFDDRTVGVPCMPNVAKDHQVLTTLANYFCPLQTGVKSPSVKFLMGVADFFCVKAATG